jgi:hypothetical protein
MTREAFLEALVQRVEAAWGDMDAPVTMADAFDVSFALTQLGRELWRIDEAEPTLDGLAETAEPVKNDDPTLF